MERELLHPLTPEQERVSDAVQTALKSEEVTDSEHFAHLHPDTLLLT